MEIKRYKAMNGAGDLIDCVKFTGADGGHLHMPTDIPPQVIEGLRNKLAARIAMRAAGAWMPSEESDIE